MLCDVPQDPILLPALFMLYIHYLCNVLDVLKFILFVDDTNIFFTGTNVEEMCDTHNYFLASTIKYMV